MHGSVPCPDMTGAKQSLALYRRLITWVQPYTRLFVLSQLGLAAAALLEPVLPALLTPLLDGSFVAADSSLRWQVPLALVGVSAAIGVLEYAGNVALTTVGNRVVQDLRTSMFRRLVQLPAAFYDDQSTGVLVSKLTFDAQQTLAAATQTIQTLVKDGLAVLALTAYLIWLDAQLSLVVMLVGPPIALIVMAVSGRLRRTSLQQQEGMAWLTQVTEEAVSAHRVVKVYGGQEHELTRFKRAAEFAAKSAVRAAKAALASTPLIQLILAAGIGAVVWVAAGRAVSGALSVGEFASFFTATTMLVAPIKRLAGVNQHLQRGLAACESIFALMDTEAEPDRGGRDLGRAQGEIRFEGVRFRYPHGHDWALDQVNLVIPAGSTLALIGASGSGKSTLAGLLVRLYHATEGRVLLDGIDVQALTLNSLRRQIAWVSQDVVLFNDSLRNNIAYGALRGTSLDAVRRAADAAHAGDFIARLPQGFEALIGENGVRLSGGERQRIAIARALLKDAPILILDEATSALDSESEQRIQAALETLRKGRTCLIIAHRLSTVEHADFLAVLEQGRLVEFGRPADLRQRGGYYASLRQMQLSPTSAGRTTGA